MKRFTLLQSASVVRQFQGTMTYKHELRCPVLSLSLPPSFQTALSLSAHSHCSAPGPCWAGFVY